MQETWLLDCDLTYLASLNIDFYAKGLSSICTSEDVLRGQPHGGMAIMWRKCISSNCQIVDLDDQRLMGVKFDCNGSTIFIVNIYMPYCCENNTEDFMFYLTKMENIMADADTPYVFAIGDFNADCNKNTSGVIQHKFGLEINKFCSSEGLIISDVMLLQNSNPKPYTYFSEAHNSVSWLDHVVSSSSGH